MKKISLWLLGAMAFGLVSCEDAPAVAPIQTNPQESVLTTGDVVGAATIASELNLESYRDKSDLEVLKIESSENLPEGSTLSFRFEVSSNEDFTKEYSLGVNLVDNIGSINPEALNEIHYTLFGKKMDPVTVYYRIPVYVNYNGVSYRLGGTDYYMAQGSYQETCMDPGLVIYDNYYLLSDVTSWNLEPTADNTFWHPAVDPYDYPIFSIVIESPGNTYWKVLPQIGMDNQSSDYEIGPQTDGDTSMSGTLTDTKPGAGRIEEPGFYRISIDMEAMTYQITRYDERPYLCTPGGQNGWSQAASQWIDYSGGRGYYCGAVCANGEFKFSINDWSLNWGGSDGYLVTDGPNIAANGLNWAVVDVNNLTYSVTHVESVGVVGGLNGWSAEAPIELAPNADETVWTGEVDLTGEWKLILNHTWDSNYGGSIYYPVFDGSNISGYEGHYTVTVNFSGNYPLITIK